VPDSIRAKYCIRGSSDSYTANSVLKNRAGVLRGLVMHSPAKYGKLRNGHPGSWFLNQTLVT
jgi:hypothetical protein